MEGITYQQYDVLTVEVIFSLGDLGLVVWGRSLGGGLDIEGAGDTAVVLVVPEFILNAVIQIVPRLREHEMEGPTRRWRSQKRVERGLTSWEMKRGSKTLSHIPR